MTPFREFLVRLGRNAAARLGSQTWAKLLTLVLTSVMLRLSGAAELGRYLMALTVVGIVLSVADLGLSVFLTREAAKVAPPAVMQSLVGDILIIKIFLAAAGYMLVLVGSLVLPLPPATRRLLPVAGLTLIPDAANATLHAFLTGRQRLDLAGGLFAVTRSAAALGGLAVLLCGWGSLAVLWCGVVAGILGLLLGLFVLRRQACAPIVDLRTLVREAVWRGAINESLPFAATGIIAMLYTRLDLLLLGSWHGEVVAGWYAAAYRLWEAAHLIPSSLLDALFPEMSRRADSPGGTLWLRRLLGAGGAMLAVLGVGLAAGGALTGRHLLRWLYGADAAGGAIGQTWQLLVWAIPAVFLYLLGGQVLYAVGEQRRVTTRMLVVALVNTLANIALIPRWRYMGAASAMILSEWTLCVLLWGEGWRVVNRRLDQAEGYGDV